jgi:hypothetical protein
MWLSRIAIALGFVAAIATMIFAFSLLDGDNPTYVSER